jgi:peptidoglycan hydrolase-like protein with peptidoglycan-binding domain
MRTLRCRQTLPGCILAALAAGGWTVPAATAQTTASNASSNNAASSTGAAHVKTTGAAVRKSSKSGKSSSRKRSRRVKGQTAPMPDRIGEIQAALAKYDSYEGVPTGKWDASTAEALRKYQAAHGLSPTGKLDALTLQKLGLGSETAGVAPPTPPPNATVNRLLSRSAQRDEIKNENQPE